MCSTQGLISFGWYCFFLHITVWGSCFSLGSRRFSSVRCVLPPRRLHNSSQPHFSHLTYHSTTHHSSTSHTSLSTAQLITAPLLTPHLSHLHFSHHLSHRHSSQLHFSHLTHHIIIAQLITAPWSADCLSRGRRSTQSLLEELRRA